MPLSHHPLKPPSLLSPHPFNRKIPLPLLQPSSIHIPQTSKTPTFSFTPLLPASSSFSSADPSLYFSLCRSQNDPSYFTLAPSSIAEPAKSDFENNNMEETEKEEEENKGFWAAVSLIIGTAVGPGMLGLPSATIKAGTFPSTLSIILSWVYVISSIILIAELSFSAMEEDRVQEVSFTALATRALGPSFGAFVSVVYACLSFSLLIACVSGIGSLVSQQFRTMIPVIAYSLFPFFVGVVIGFFPFKAIDFANRLLCVLMLFSISTLVAIGLSVGRSNLLSSFAFASWSPEAIMPAIPVTVLTLGFHVITPFVCKLLRHSVYDARKAILFGGFVPLVMVLSWNVVVLGLAGGAGIDFQNPIKLLLSVKASALPAVQGFAFAALATSLIGYAVSFPKQLLDTVRLVAERLKWKDVELVVSPSGNQRLMDGGCIESEAAGHMRVVGGASFAGCIPQMHPNVLMEGTVNENCRDGSKNKRSSGSHPLADCWNSIIVTWIVLIVPIFIASFLQGAFVKALDFAGVYANCFLFGVLPPAMAWINRSRKSYRSDMSTGDLLPGGNLVLALLFGIAVILGFWH